VTLAKGHPDRGREKDPLSMVEKFCHFTGLSSLLRTTLIGLVLLLSIADAAVGEPRRVLLVHAFGHAYSPWSDMAGSFRAELIKRSQEPILDTARVKDPQDEMPLVQYIRALLVHRKPDLIVPIGAPSAFFMQRNGQLLFPATPMLIVGADKRRIPSNSLAVNDVAVLLDLDLPA